MRHGRTAAVVGGLAMLLAALSAWGLTRTEPGWPVADGPVDGWIAQPVPQIPDEAPEVDGARDIDELRRILNTVAEQRFTTGIGVAVVVDGELALADGFGFADAAHSIPMTADSVFRVGSISKSFTSLALVDLEARGLLHLSDPVRMHLPQLEFENPWEDTDPVRVTHLLEHTSGFDEMHFNEIVASPGQLDMSPAEVLAINPRSRQVRWRPGTRHAYSHPGYTAAGAVIEAVSGQSFEDHLVASVFRPLGLDRASFRYTPDVAARLVPAYQPSLELLPLHHIHHRPGGGLYISIADLGRYVQALTTRGVLDGRQAVPAKNVLRIETGGTLPYPGLDPSYGLGNYSMQLDRVMSQGHGGWMPGYNSGFRYFPELRGGYALASNEPRNWMAIWRIDSEVRKFLLHGTPRRERPAPHRVSPEALDQLTGTYRFRSISTSFLEGFFPNQTRRVFRRGDSIAMRGHGAWGGEVIATSDTTFRYPQQFRSSIMFTRSPEGDPILVDANGFSYYERCSAIGALALDVWHVATTAVLFSALFSPLLWAPLVLFGKRIEAAWARGLPSLGAWALTLMVRTVFLTPANELGEINASSVAVFLLSWAVGILAITSTIATVAEFRRPERSDASLVIRVYAAMVTVALCGWTAQFALHGFIGLRTWVW